VHGAVYDAVNAIDRRYEPYLGAPRARRWYSKDAAAATAAYRVLVGLLPAQQPALEALYAASLASVPAGRARDGGIAVGQAAAETMLAARANDGRFGPFRFPVGTAPGQWRPTPPAFVNDPNAWVGKVTPFLIRSADQFNSRGPNALTSRKYAKEFNEVKSIGSLTSPVRTADQTDAARFWAGGFAPLIVASLQLSIAHDLGIADNARLFAMLYLTGADAGIACWDDKARWLFWRPITAIREAAADGNPATEPDANWVSLINAPPYPDHPSGLMCFSGAFTHTLRDFFGTDRIAFSVTSANSGTTRSYTSFSHAVEEGIDARVWSGIHFRIADEQGARIGKQVARYRAKHYFHRLRHCGSKHDFDSGHKDD
jgi:PAP2 superfamily